MLRDVACLVFFGIAERYAMLISGLADREATGRVEAEGIPWALELGKRKDSGTSNEWRAQHNE